MAAQMKKRIVLWGTTQVGKTALLATALYGGGPDLAGLRRDYKDGALHTFLFDTWLRLHNNQWVPPTASDETTITLSTDSGTEIELVDIRGGLTLELRHTGNQQILRSSDAILFFAEYNGANTGSQMAAIKAAVVETSNKPCALALTKCERWLKSDDEIWERQTGWLENTPLWAAHSQVLNRFRTTAWPTSAFGYTEPYELPATIIGEMGQALPFRIQPKNVGKPLAALLRSLECL